MAGRQVNGLRNGRSIPSLDLDPLNTSAALLTPSRDISRSEDATGTRNLQAGVSMV